MVAEAARAAVKLVELGVFAVVLNVQVATGEVVAVAEMDLEAVEMAAAEMDLEAAETVVAEEMDLEAVKMAVVEMD